MNQSAISAYLHCLEFSVQATPDGAQGLMEIGSSVRNPFGTVHAGALIWFADVVATRAAMTGSTIGPEGQGFPLAVTLNAQLLTNRKDGALEAKARLVRKGRRIIVVRTEVSDEAGQVLLDLTSTHTPSG